MKDKLLLVGAGGFGRVALEHAQKQYDCAFVDDGYAAGTIINGAEVVGKISDIARLFGKYKKLIVAIGNNTVREKVYKEAAAIGYSFPNVIVGSAYVSPFAFIGAGCILLNNVVVQNNAKVGNGVILNPGVEVHNDSVVEDYALIYTNSVIRTFAVYFVRDAHFARPYSPPLTEKQLTGLGNEIGSNALVSVS